MAKFESDLQQNHSNSEHSSNIDKSISCRVFEFHFSGCFNE
jgi:hypothetical protein